MATTLTTEQYYNGTGSQTNFAFTFPYQKESDVKVEHPIGTVLTAKTPSAANDYEILTGTTIKFTTAPASGTNNVKVYRDTNVDSAHAIFSAGSSIRATDLNTNIEQLLFTKQDKIQASHITANTITNTHISDAAEIEVSKLKDGSARQILQTDPAGTGVEWTSNIDIPGSLDVTGNADIDGALNVDGAADVGGDFKVNTNKFTVAASSGNTVIAGNLDVTGQFDVTGTSNYTGQQTVPGGALVKDIRVGLDGNNEVSTASGNLVLDSASGTVQVTDHFNVTGNADVDVNLNVDGTLTVDGTSTLTGNVSVGGTVDGRDIAADGTKLDGIEAGATGDQTNAEIRAAVEAASDSNVFTDADHSKLNAIEAGATADQTAAEIRTAVEAASDSNVFTDADHSKLNAIEASATADQTAAEIRTLVEAASDSNVFTDADHSKLNAIEASATADQTAAEIKTLYESNANTNALTDAEKLVIDGVTANTSELNTLDGITASTAELNITTGMSKATSLTSTSNTEYPTSKAVNDRIVELMQASGGFFPIADDQSFPNANPDPNNDAGTIVSISDAGGLVINSSGVTTTGRTLGGATVTITGIDSSLHSTTIGAGKGMLVQTTSTLNTYTYHRLTLDEGGVASAQTLVSDFNQRYRIGPSNPTSSLDDGDLFFNTTSDTMLVYNATASNWDEVQTRGNYFINTLSSFSGTGGNSASFDNTAYKFGLSHAGASAQQHLVSINGVLQKPNAGTSVPSEGFALDGSTIIFSTPPPAGSDYFIVTIGASVNIGTPGNNSITSAMIIDGSIVNGDISNSAAIASSKLAKPIDFNDGEKARFGTGNDLEIFFDGSNSYIKEVVAPAGQFIIDGWNGVDIRQGSTGEPMIRANGGNDVELYYDNSKKFETTSAGVNIASGNLQVGGTNVINSGLALYNLESLKLADSKVAKFGSGDDLQIWHDGSHSYISDEGSGQLRIRSDSNIWLEHGTENMIVAKGDNAVELYYDNALKLSTASGGVNVAGNLNMNGADSYQLRLGANNDLKLYHDGSHTNIVNTNGNLYITNDNGGTINLQTDSADNAVKCIENAAVELFYDGVKKFETYSDGVEVTGDFWIDNPTNAGKDLWFDASGNFLRAYDNVKFTCGTSNDLQIYHDGSHSFIDSTLAGAQLLIRTKESGGTTNNAAKFMPTGAVELYYDGSKKFETTNTGATITGGIIAGGLTYPTSDGSNGQVLTTNGSGALSWTSTAGGLSDLVGDTSPQLGGDLDTNSFEIFLDDNHALICGNGNDFRMYHDGTHSYLQNGTNNLYIRSTNTETGIAVIPNGAVKLFYDNSAKFETFSWGARVHGNLSLVDSNYLYLGAGNDLKIYHDGSHSFMVHDGQGHFYIKTTGTDEDIVINADRDVFIQCSSGENALHADKDGGVKLYYNNAKKFETYSNGIIVQAHEGGAAYINLYADEGDDNADKWRLRSNTNGDFSVQNYASGDWETTLLASGNGKIELRYDNVKKLETTSSGVTLVDNLHLDNGTNANRDVQWQPGSNRLAFWDHVKATFGDGADLEIYHNGSHSYVYNSGTGNLYLQDNGYVEIGKTDESMLGCHADGAVKLYYNGSKKFETTSAGVAISGNALLYDGNKIQCGHVGDLEIFHDGTNSYIDSYTNNLIIRDLGGGHIQLRGDDVQILNQAGTETMVNCIEDGGVELYHNNAKRLETSSSGVDVIGELYLADNTDLKIGNGGDLKVYHNGSHSYIWNTTGDLQLRSNAMLLCSQSGETYLQGAVNGTTSLWYDNSKKLQTESWGVRMEDQLGLLDSKKLFLGTSNDLEIYHDGGNSWLREVGTGALYIDSYNGAGIFLTANNANENMITAYKDGAVSLYHNNSKKFETVSGGAKVTGDLEVTGSIAGGVGKILQVVTNTITGAQSGTNNSDSSENTTDLTGFSLNITPSSTSSKILVMATISQSSTNWSFMVHAYRDSTIIAKGDDLGGNRSEFTFCIGNARDYNDATGTSTVHIIDSPSTTSQVTYKLKGCTRGSNSTWHINRSARHSQYNSAWIHSTVSTFTLMEIG